MPRGTLISDFERDIIRIGKAKGIQNADIARALGRTRASVTQQVKAMTERGTLDELPLAFVVDDIADMIRRKGSAQ